MSIVNPGTWDDWQGGGGSSDTSPPFVIGRSPPAGAVGVPKSNRLLSFHLADSGTGIDNAYISATIAGATYTCSSGLSCTGSPNDIAVTYVNASDWTENQAVAVSINARDIAGNVMPAVSYSFSIGAWTLAWSDEFDTVDCTTQSPCPPDLTKWIYEVSSDTDVGMSPTDNNHYYMNRDAGWGTDRTENVRVENGTLILETRNDNWQGHGVTSARLRTAGGYSDATTNPWVVKKQIQYGRLEARARMDSGDGLWSAFWTAGVGPDNWPASGEMDILEQPYWVRIGNNMTSSIHSGTLTKHISTTMFSGDPSTAVPGFDITQYHIYTIEWKPGEVKLFYDYELIYTATPVNQPYWPFDASPQDIRLWHGFNASYGASASTTLSTPKRITFDYVRYYTQGVIAPTVVSLSPSYAIAGDIPFTLTVTGTDFLSGARVRWNGTDRVTTFVSPTQLQASIPATDLVRAGTIPVTVFNPDGGISNTMRFEVSAPVSTPTVVSLSPSFATAGGTAFTLTLSGTGFLSGAKVRWNGSDRATTFRSATQLQAGIPATDIAAAGTIPVTMLNPDGGVSNTMNFEVKVPVPVSTPTVTGLSPFYATAGTASFTLTVNGSGFLPGAKVRWNGTDRVTTFVSATQLQASILAADIAAARTTPVTVLNPDGGASNGVGFDILPGIVSLTITPTTVAGGNTSTGTVTLNGPAPTGGTVVSLSSGNIPVANVPATVTVLGGNTSATFTITTTPISTSTSVTISAVYGGVMRSSTLTVNRPALLSVSSSPSTIAGGNTSTGTVTLSGPVPSGGIVVALSSSNTSVARVPANITVPAGNTSANFTITTSAVSSSRSVTISANFGGVKRSTALSVRR